MKYYTQEILTQYYSANNEEREFYGQLLDQKMNAYYQEFDTVKKRLPKSFMKIYDAACHFHDHEILGITIINKDPKAINITLKIKNYDVVYELTYFKVNNVRINYCNDDGRSQSLDTWLYDEFLEVDNNLLSHEMVFVSGASFYVEFKRIKLIKYKCENDKEVGITNAR